MFTLIFLPKIFSKISFDSKKSNLVSKLKHSIVIRSTTLIIRKNDLNRTIQTHLGDLKMNVLIAKLVTVLNLQLILIDLTEAKS